MAPSDAFQLDSLILRRKKKERDPDDEEDGSDARSDSATEWRWLKTFPFEVVENESSAEPLVTAIAHVIKRDMMRGSFHMLMDEPSQEMYEFSSAVFDNQGRIRQELVKGPDAGSGVFGQELSRGDIGYIEEVRVRSERRLQGLGTWTVQQLLARPEFTSCPFVYTWPIFLPGDGARTDNEREVQVKLITKFWRKSGFRRIGNTEFFAFARSNPSHPSRLLPLESDWNPPETTSSLPTAEIRDRFPLHAAIGKFVQFFQQGGVQAMAAQVDLFDTMLRLTYNQDPSKLDEPDLEGNTPMHVAAVSKNARVVQMLLGFAGARERVAKVNKQGLTPLRLLEKAELQMKEMAMNMMGLRVPDDEASAAIKKLLTDAAGGDVGQAAGCTCGGCVDGWLSPRRLFQLQNVAGGAHDICCDSIDCAGFEKGKPLPADDVLVYLFDYVPGTVRQGKMYKSFPLGYAECFKVIAHILDIPAIPTPSVVLPAVLASSAVNHRCVNHYFSHGGTVDYVLDAVVSRAQEEEDEGEFEYLYKDEHARLPTCANDARTWFEIKEKLLDGSTHVGV